MRRVHLICNAHIDPIWQWTWDEGISAVIATFKSAADESMEKGTTLTIGVEQCYYESKK